MVTIGVDAEANVHWSIDQKSKKKIKVFSRSAGISTDRPFWTLSEGN